MEIHPGKVDVAFMTQTGTSCLSLVADDQYIGRLQSVIRRLHGCDSTHIDSVPVHGVFHGQTIWDGLVEVFALAGHPKARKAYAWSRPDDKADSGGRCIVALEVLPVESPATAVWVSIVADIMKHLE
jgi:hypothetical protein